jgi:hypothetical protein
MRTSIAATLMLAWVWQIDAEDEKAASGAPPTAPAVASSSSGKETALTADQALKRLIAGNERYVAGTTTHPDQTTDRRAELAKGQFPFAIVLTCSDSRVAPELFLDQGLGNLFVIRNAGNILDDHVIGSMEYCADLDKGIEDAALVLGGNADARVCHRDAEPGDCSAMAEGGAAE